MSYIKSRQSFLFRSFYSRISAVRNSLECDFSDKYKLFSSKEKFYLTSLLRYKKNFIGEYNFYNVTTQGITSSFSYFTFYTFCLDSLLKLSIYPFVEINLSRSPIIFYHYNFKCESIIEIRDIFLEGFKKLWYFNLIISDCINCINKPWFLRNFPLEKNFLKFLLGNKDFSSYSFLLQTFFNYLLNGLL